MRKEERIDLASKSLWFVFALFMAFFAYGEAHDLEKEALALKNGNDRQEALLARQSRDLATAGSNKKILEAVAERYDRLEGQVPSAADLDLVLRSLADLARDESVTLLRVSFRLGTPAKGEAVGVLGSEVTVAGKYAVVRNFIEACETHRGEEKAGLTFRTSRMEAGVGKNGLVKARLHLETMIGTR